MFDIVIMWIDWSSKKLIENMIKHGGRSEGCEEGEFIELKYVLRSLKKHKVNYRKIFIVHSDDHEPPKYLKETDTLKFVKHSELVKDKKHLPLIHRESILAHLHRIPDLSNFFFNLEDDQFIMNSKIFDEILNSYNNNKIYVHRKKMKINYDVNKPMGLYNLAMVNSSLLFNKNIDNVVQQTHWIDFFDKRILYKIEQLYPKHFLYTQSYQNQNTEAYKEKYIIALPCIFYNYLFYIKKFDLLDANKLNVLEIHTNGYTNNSNLENLKNKLELSTNKWLLNAQGNGISDEYPKCETVHTLFYSFLENTFKNKTEYEKDFKGGSNNNQQTTLSILFILFILFILILKCKKI